MVRTGLIYDAHCPYQDNDAYYMALDFLRNLKPKLNKLILAGDYVDFYKVSFWRTDPNRMSFEDEVKIARSKLKELKQMFYRIPIHYLEGNHEERLFNHVRDKAPNLLWNNGVPQILDLKSRNISYSSNVRDICNGKSPLKLGKLFVLHGHEKKVSVNAINLAKLFYDKCRVNVIAGHHHKTDYSLFRKLDGTHEGAWTVGTLGKLSEEYQPISNWNHGFAYVDELDNGLFEVNNKIIIEGKIINS